MYTLPDLPDSTAREVYARLCDTLPPLPTDDPEIRAARDADAMAAVAALHPTDAIEARIAADIVGMEAYATDSLQLAGEFRNDTAATLRCRAQATSTYRQMRALLRDYRSMQAERDKAFNEGHPAAMQRAGYWWKEVTISAAAPSPAPAAAPEPEDPPKPAPAAPAFENLTAAEQYAVLYPGRARLIRAGGGLPARLDFGPPAPDIVHALVHGTGPILLALDRPALAEAAE
jgi:hypothetical protein